MQIDLATAFHNGVYLLLSKVVSQEVEVHAFYSKYGAEHQKH